MLAAIKDNDFFTALFASQFNDLTLITFPDFKLFATARAVYSPCDFILTVIFTNQCQI